MAITSANLEVWFKLLQAQSLDKQRMLNMKELDAQRPIEIREWLAGAQDFFDDKISLKEFASEFNKRAKKRDAGFGLNGLTGGMFISTISKFIPETEKPGMRLRELLSHPENEIDASKKLGRFVAYLDELKSREVFTGHQISIGFVPFFASVWWHFRNTEEWPIYYSASKKVLIENGAYTPSKRIAEDYFSFRSVYLSLMKALKISSWELEHACFWHVNLRNPQTSNV